MISVIIALHNEEEQLIKSRDKLSGLSRLSQLIFVDGQSSDNSAALAARYGKVFKTRKNRAAQFNQGAAAASGDIFLFLHADNIICPLTLDSIKKKISSGCVGGCLTQRLQDKNFIYRLIEAQGNFRARLTRAFYGDQGIFASKDVFFAAGGFPEVPILEDILFSREMRKFGPTAVLPDNILVSVRRWRKQGILKTAMLFSLILLLFHLRVPLDKVKRLYPETR